MPNNEINLIAMVRNVLEMQARYRHNCYLHGKSSSTESRQIRQAEKHLEDYMKNRIKELEAAKKQPKQQQLFN